MGYAKERGKLEKLLTKINGLTNYDDKSLTIITDIYEQFSHAVRILKNKNTDTFNQFYEKDLQQVKEVKKALKQTEEDVDRQPNFQKYKDTLASALENTIQATKESN